MKYIAAFLIVVAGLAGGAYALGWFTVATSQEDGKSQVSISIDQEKVRKDTAAAKQALEKTTDQVRQGIHEATR